MSAAAVTARANPHAPDHLTKIPSQAKLRRLKNGGKTTRAAPAGAPTLDDRRQRDEIRAWAWARAQGMVVSPVGSISAKVMDAWNNRDSKAAVPAQRAG